MACVTVAALMQYFFMAALCWMLVEGICLYLFVVKVYNFNHKMSVYHGMSWGKDNERCIESSLREATKPSRREQFSCNTEQ